ncbi:MAG: BatA and WFA domain-containing protein [Acidobacteriaceae bacterium]|nr:BatA and WFA domain-containing protein [Acidobacteriaceae bacterium]
MGFLSPWFLAAAGAVALPLWLHLLRQYKREPQPFSSVMFFERRLQSSVKHRRLRYLALLALRIALLALLAVAFANPFIWRTETIGGHRKLTVIAIDRSFSMRYEGRMQQAKAEANRIIDGLHGQDFGQVAAFDSHVENLTQPEADSGVLRAAVDSVQPGDLASSFGEVARAMRVLSQSSGMDLDVHLISDMQQSSLPPAFRDLQMGPHTSLSLHQAGKSDAPNWAVENVTAPARVYGEKNTRVTASLAGWRTLGATKRVSLVLDGKTIATQEVSIPANGRAQVEFLSFGVPYGAHRGEVRMQPGDKLPNDDSFAFSVERSDPRRVLLLYAGGRPQQAFFYKSALESASDTGLTVDSEAIELASREDFARFAYVVLSDVGDPGDTLNRALEDYVRRGGAVLVALGQRSASHGRVPISGERFTEQRQAEGVGFLDAQHAALAGVAHLDNVQVFDWMRLQPKTGARVLAKLADGSPLLVEESIGEGRLLIFTSSLDNSGNDFALHASFVPFVAQMGRYLAGGEETPSSVTAGTPVALRRTREKGTAADVIGPDGRHELSIKEGAQALTFELARAGYYEIQRADGRRTPIAVNADRRESDLTTIPAETLALWRNTGDTTTGAQPSGAERQSEPRSLWRYALLLVLAAALAESMFGSRYLRQERQAA